MNMVKAAISDYTSLGDYALIGDCETAALVSREGSIDWYCPGRFDAPAAFCRLHDERRGGYLSIAPVAPHVSRRRYRDRTNILENTYFSADGIVRTTDFMPVHQSTDGPAGKDAPGIRGIFCLVEAVSGTVDVEVRFKPTFDY